MRYTVYIVALILFSVNSLFGQTVVISEIMSKNTNSIVDFEGDHTDWIELYNDSDEIVDITSWHLSDDDEILEKWTFPSTVIGPYQHLLIFASDKNIPSLYHTNFKISQEGEDLFLTDNFGDLVQFFDGICIPEDKSAIVDTEDFGYYYCDVPSPGEANQNEFEFSCYDKIITSISGGFYENTQIVDLSSTGDYPIHYTIDGSDPDLLSGIFIQPTAIGEADLSPEDWSFVPTAEDWLNPQLPIKKATVLKASTFYDECLVSEAFGETYFIGAGFPPLENTLVFSLSTNPEGLFDEEIGMYVPGVTGVNFLGLGGLWERDGHLEIFNDQGEKLINQRIEFKNRGKSSRFKPQKSLRFTAKERLDHEYFNYPLFERRDQINYKSINLRSGQSGFTHSMIADVLSASIMDDTHLDFQESQLAVLYINGEFWGIHDARENLDEHYLSQYYDVDEDEVIILKNSGEELEGSNEDYLDLIDYIRSNDLSKDDPYANVSSRIDIESFIDVTLFNMYLGNWDWPHNNVEFWRPIQDGEKYRWFFFDCDACFYKDGFDPFKFFNDPNTNEWDRIILSKLLTNNTFKTQFTLRFYELMNQNFRADRILNKIDSLQELYEPLIIHQIKRWNTPPNMSAWNDQIDEMRRFVLSRPEKFIELIQEKLGNPLSFYPNPTHDYIHSAIPEGLEDVQFFIYDQFGKLIQSLYSYPPDGIYVGDLSSGLYILKIKVGSVHFTDRFIVEK